MYLDIESLLLVLVVLAVVIWVFHADIKKFYSSHWGAAAATAAAAPSAAAVKSSFDTQHGQPLSPAVKRLLAETSGPGMNNDARAAQIELLE